MRMIEYNFRGRQVVTHYKVSQPLNLLEICQCAQNILDFVKYVSLVDRAKIEVILDVTLEVTLILYFSYGIKFYAAEFKFDFHGEWMGC